MKYLFFIALTFLYGIHPLGAQESLEFSKSNSEIPVQSDISTLKFSYFDAIILGLVEGITEYLPISSTGHLIIVSHWLGLDQTPETKKSLDAYLIIIQIGAILAVSVLYRKRIQSLCQGIIGNNPNGRNLAFHLIIAFLPAAIIGILFNHWIEQYLFSLHTVTVGLILGALFIFVIKIPKKPTGKSIESLNKRSAFLIGLMQVLALWPGMSRSLVTILGAIIVGLSLIESAEFSFLLGLITLSAACVYKMMHTGSQLLAVMPVGPALLGIAIAFLSALIAIRWLVTYLVCGGLNGFAYYRIALAVMLILFI